MTNAIETRNLTRRYRDTVALDDVTVSFQTNTITGLLGRNGAGKTTLMALITAQDLATSGELLVQGQEPFERAPILSEMCFIRDNQRYPDDYKLGHAVRAAKLFAPNWSQELADELIGLFRIPAKTQIRKLSRGQLSAVGIVIGLASRAPITFFDEPYLGLDATARSIFYDVLLRDYQEHPRTIVLSTHLIDEMDRLLERVIVLDRGRVVQDADVESLRGSVYGVAGRVTALTPFLEGRKVISRRTVGGLATAIVEGTLSREERELAVEAGLDLTAVSLQELVAAYGLAEAYENGNGAHTEGNAS
ncbi:ABC transporter ATP-binding protein [Leucobacter sp. UCMA 4100]|uniref:ATP-binding cassette domain-containing protein n=1 Tax=Leucobacter sp. UCMA 4100 TaxID=2810534 RepID=UPI0022EB3204|nr:ABC transporter ATP-binding protein [Leucobacter sp. UCMA 4100]MDA3146103.1 ABC transporter ATP-binding protein [Leucobacter sp. UCMA 4100]